ncbi:MAG: XRE family transcriptional regulator [Acidobacteria bacterium]|nr:MAG: XRE family transcriptional regulator [Acidobacteriota bacterium]REK02340.1 MAG: XRE family transcriptional regulator [Acidobacteriota bacterium]REK13858.1 MAG: XRE family transcriptional regulator [Acidobacteriota bacterium]REK41853.1 MAG: XRE family transcriptional regulator [Acidobacteriota bacterium]
MEKERLLKIFGRRVRRLRMARGLSQESLSFKAKMHRTYIGMVERGEKNITFYNLFKLSEALGISVRELTDINNDD